MAAPSKLSPASSASLSVLRIETAPVFAPLLEPARDKGAWGGGGSGKSHFFAELLVEDAVRFPGDAGEGLRAICGREIQKSLKDSAKHLIEYKLAAHGLGEADGFKVYTDKIETPGDGLVVFQGLQDLRSTPDQYDHIWEGGYATVLAGAYYAQALALAKMERRIGRVAFDPLMRVRVFCDLGGTGAKADAFAMWPAQFIGREIRTRDYYEAQGQPLATHIQWLHSRGYTPAKADIYLPHDGATNDSVYDVSFESALALR